MVSIAVGCSSSKESTLKRLQGHWHSVGYPFLISMEIEDSLVSLFRYSLQIEERRLQLFDSIGSILLPVPCGCGGAILPVMSEFYFSGDTLVYDNDEILDECYAFKPMKFIKSNPAVCQWSHYVFQNVLTVRLPTSKSGIIEVDSIKKNSLTGFISIGPPKDPEFGVEPKIQVQDVFISIKDIPIFISVTKQRNSIKSKQMLSVVLALDSTVRKPFLDSVLNAIPKSDSIKLFRLVKAKDSDKLGYERISYSTTN